MADFRERFLELLKSSDLSAKDFVQEFNEFEPKDIRLSDSTISEIKGKNLIKPRVPRADVIIKIAAFFGVSTDYLLGVSDIMTPDKNLESLSDLLHVDPDVLAHFTELPDYMSKYCIVLEYLMSCSVFDSLNGDPTFFDTFDAIMRTVHNKNRPNARLAFIDDSNKLVFDPIGSSVDKISEDRIPYQGYLKDFLDVTLANGLVKNYITSSQSAALFASAVRNHLRFADSEKE